MQLCLTPMTLQDRPSFDRAVLLAEEGNPTPLATWAFAPHYIWKEVFTYEWVEIEGWYCLFAEYVDGVFMPLPPLGTHSHICEHGPDGFRKAIEQVMKYMSAKNHGTEVSRIENVPEELKKRFDDMGFKVRAKDPDYLYRREDLVNLKGDRYKSARAAYNQFLRENRVQYQAYETSCQEECLLLFHRWSAQKEVHHVKSGRASDIIARYMLQDAESAHRIILQSPEALGLIGRVILVDGMIRGYTFGFEKSANVFCVLVEVVDRTCNGGAQYLFREFCREMEQYTFINSMDDSGLPSLARSKQAYHPIQMVANYIVSPR